MSRWMLHAQKGGINGPNFQVHRDGRPTRIVVYETGSGLDQEVLDWVAFIERLAASKYEVLKEPDLPDYLPDRD